MIPWYPMSLPASVIPCVLCTILMDIILNKGDCAEQPDKNCMSKFWIEAVVVSAGGTVSRDQPWLVTRDILSWQTMSFRGLADKRWHNISLIFQHINTNVINSQRKLFFAYKNVLMTLLNIKIALPLFLRRQYWNQPVATFRLFKLQKYERN